jgi:hypothetical protein
MANPVAAVHALAILAMLRCDCQAAEGANAVITKARSTGLVLLSLLAACWPGNPRAPLLAAPDQVVASAATGVHVLEVDRRESTASDGQVLARVRNAAPEPAIVGVDVRAEPGMWLAPTRQEISVFYLPPNGERTLVASYSFARLSPESALRVRIGLVEEHPDGRFHVPEPAAVLRFDMGASAEAAAFLEGFDRRTARHVTIYAVRGVLTLEELDAIAGERDRAVTELVEILGVQPAPELRIVFYPDGPSKTADTRHVGNGLTRGNAIVEIRNDSVQLDPYHELAHLLAGQLGWAPAWLNEGFAVWVTERLGADALEFIAGPGTTVDEAVCRIKGAGELLPMAELMQLADIGPEESRPHTTYPQAASFVGFLAERYSLDALRQAYATMSPAATAEENETAFARAFGVSSDEAAAQWLTALRNSCHGL